MYRDSLKTKNKNIGSVTTEYRQPAAPNSTTPTVISDTYQIPNIVEVPALDREPTEDVTGSFWTNCDEFRGMALSESPPPEQLLILNEINSNNTGTIKGYNLSALMGYGNVATNNVARFDFNAFITRKPRCDIPSAYAYYLNLVPFKQSGSDQYAYLYDTITKINPIQNIDLYWNQWLLEKEILQ